MPSNVAAATGFAKVTGMVCAPLCPGLSESRTLPPWQGNQDRRHHCSQGGNQSLLVPVLLLPFSFAGDGGCSHKPLLYCHCHGHWVVGSAAIVGQDVRHLPCWTSSSTVPYIPIHPSQMYKCVDLSCILVCGSGNLC